jgi:hypothetical protein
MAFVFDWKCGRPYPRGALVSMTGPTLLTLEKKVRMLRSSRARLTASSGALMGAQAGPRRMVVSFARRCFVLA